MEQECQIAGEATTQLAVSLSGPISYMYSVHYCLISCPSELPEYCAYTCTCV